MGDVSRAAQLVMNQGFMSNLNSYFGSRSGGALPGNVSNTSVSTQYSLNVSTAQASQGIIQDFTIMKMMNI